MSDDRVRAWRRVLVAIAAFGLCAVLAFAVEPSTSTVADIHEGDGVAVVLDAAVSAKGAAGLQALAHLLQLVLATVAALAVLVVVPIRLRPVTEVAPASSTDPERRSAVERRGPPALAAA